MRRRTLLKATVIAPFCVDALRSAVAPAAAAAQHLPPSSHRPRPGDSAWPTPAAWERLNQQVAGRLTKLESAFASCSATPDGGACTAALKIVTDPFALGDTAALTQTSGWTDAWISQPSAYAVAAETTADVVAAVNFARQHRLRLVVKGGGHSYQGTSAAPDSLLVWTRRMNQVRTHEAFVGVGCTGKQAPQPAVTLGSGAMWIDAYTAVTSRAGRYVQGGGCTTVGVAGLVQSGGFGSFSKKYGLAAAGLLEAEIVTADGEVRIANAATHPDLYWALKGGGGGTFGVVTRMTLRTRELPEFFGAVFGAIRANSDSAYRQLIAKTIEFYGQALFNPHWGEQITFQSDNTVRIGMVFQDLGQQQAESTWAPFLEWVRAGEAYSFTSDLRIVALPARHFWDAEFLTQHAPQFVVTDDRPGSPADRFLWRGDRRQAGWFVHGYQSAWIPASLLGAAQQASFVDALFDATREWEVGLHFNKGLAGAAPEEIEAARRTATHPDVLRAFALAIIGADGPPAFPLMPGVTTDLTAARADAQSVRKAIDVLRGVLPGAGSYVSEGDYFEHNWQTAFWGENYPQLARVKHRYDPDGVFFVHHGVGSESWSDDGFTRLAT